jgi:hypothetical protein
MRIIFCADYWNPLSPDNTYEAEANAVEGLHLSYSLINADLPWTLPEKQTAHGTSSN